MKTVRYEWFLPILLIFLWICTTGNDDIQNTSTLALKKTSKQNNQSNKQTTNPPTVCLFIYLCHRSRRKIRNFFANTLLMLRCLLFVTFCSLLWFSLLKYSWGFFNCYCYFRFSKLQTLQSQRIVIGRQLVVPGWFHVAFNFPVHERRKKGISHTIRVWNKSEENFQR